MARRAPTQLGQLAPQVALELTEVGQHDGRSRLVGGVGGAGISGHRGTSAVGRLDRRQSWLVCQTVQ